MSIKTLHVCKDNRACHTFKKWYSTNDSVNIIYSFVGQTKLYMYEMTIQDCTKTKMLKLEPVVKQLNHILLVAKFKSYIYVKVAISCALPLLCYIKQTHEVFIFFFTS